ncbi:hypothetical protein [uncultured Lactobacillus sp.]|uniref:hypothetical protein n=1 Tax=uncultured Lactobacillus sp. TaxID=153152 RepID=UPI002631B417|nr:hypothetical protein [uncultured Lactobacillus sp.]
MARGIKSVMRQANRLAKGMNNGETKIISGSKINGANAVVYKARNGMVNLVGVSYEKGIARFFSDGSSHTIGNSANRTYGKARGLIFSGGAKFKRGSTGSKGG